MATTKYNFDFMGYRKTAAGVSLVLVLLSFVTLAINQVNWGLDFTGGTLVEVFYEDSISPEAIRVQLDEAGYEGHVVQYFGSDKDVLVRMPPQKTLSARENASLGDSIIASLRKEATGEVTLRGRVLPIGGLKEKLLAALRGGIKTVLIPQENEKDLVEIPDNITESLEIIPVSHVDQVLARALTEALVPVEWTEADELAALLPPGSNGESSKAVTH